jgi:D-cysteine desulfhydrase
VVSAPRALFDRLPRLADLVPFTVLADGLPTPTEQLLDGLYVLRDDRTSTRYGGNKVRKLEFVLPVAARRGGPVITAGGTGSHHVLATAVHAAALGLCVEAVVYPQPDSDDARAVADALAALDVRTLRVPSPYAMPAGLAARMVALAPQRPYLLWPGASTALGTRGYVSAGLELVDAFAAQQWKPPQDVVVALGSGGTAVGVALGLALGGWRRTQVVAVRAADALVTNRVALGALEAGTSALLALGGWRPRPASIVIDARWFGPGYGHATEAGTTAAHRAHGMGLAVDQTYTAKAFAAALDRHARGRRVAFVQTLSAVTPRPLRVAVA